MFYKSNMSNPPKQKILIIDGAIVGKLTVGDLIRDLRNHPLFDETPKSYLHQGRLRECHCECGIIRLLPEAILASGRLQSCGCYRYEVRMKAQKDKIDRLKRKAEKQYLVSQIKYEQARLRHLQVVRVPMRDEKAITECGAILRSLFARKNQLNRKETHKEVWDNTTRHTMIHKLAYKPID